MHQAPFSDEERATALRLADDIAYVFECLAQDCTGECRWHLFQLCEALERDPSLDVTARGNLLAQCRALREELVQRRNDGARGALTTTARELWQQIRLRCGSA